MRTSDNATAAKVHAALSKAGDAFNHAAMSPLLHHSSVPHSAMGDVFSTRPQLASVALHALTETVEKLVQRVSKLESLFFVFESTQQKYAGSTAPTSDVRSLFHETLEPVHSQLRHHEGLLMDLVQTLNHAACWGYKGGKGCEVTNNERPIAAEGIVLSPLTKGDLTGTTAKLDHNAFEVDDETVTNRISRLRRLAAEIKGQDLEDARATRRAGEARKLAGHSNSSTHDDPNEDMGSTATPMEPLVDMSATSKPRADGHGRKRRGEESDARSDRTSQYTHTSSSPQSSQRLGGDLVGSCSDTMSSPSGESRQHIKRLLATTSEEEGGAGERLQVQSTSPNSLLQNVKHILRHATQSSTSGGLETFQSSSDTQNNAPTAAGSQKLVNHYDSTTATEGGCMTSLTPARVHFAADSETLLDDDAPSPLSQILLDNSGATTYGRAVGGMMFLDSTTTTTSTSQQGMSHYRQGVLDRRDPTAGRHPLQPEYDTSSYSDAYAELMTKMHL